MRIAEAIQEALTDQAAKDDLRILRSLVPVDREGDWSAYNAFGDYLHWHCRARCCR